MTCEHPYHEKTFEIIGNTIRGELPNQDCGSNSASGSASEERDEFWDSAPTLHRFVVPALSIIGVTGIARFARSNKKPEVVQLETFSMGDLVRYVANSDG